MYIETRDKTMDDLTFAAIKERELKQKQELIDFVTEKLDAAVAALTERQNQIIKRLLEIEKRIMRLEDILERHRQHENSGNYEEDY